MFPHEKTNSKMSLKLTDYQEKVRNGCDHQILPTNHSDQSTNIYLAPTSEQALVVPREITLGSISQSMDPLPI